MRGLRRIRVETRLTRGELAALRKVKRYVAALSGYKSRAEALRYLIRNWQDGASATPDGVELSRLCEGLHETFRGEYSERLDDGALPVDLAFEAFDRCLSAERKLYALRARLSEVEAELAVARAGLPRAP